MKISNIRMRFVFVMIIIASGHILVICQTRDTLTQSIQIIAQYHDEAIHIRWAPSNLTLWMQCIKNGYTVHKYELDNPNNTKVLKQTTSIKPWSKAAFEPFIDGNNKYLLTAGHTMHGDWETGLSNTKNLFARMEEANNRYGLAMYVADADSLAARSLGLSWVDNDVELNTEYLYVVSSVRDSITPFLQGGISILAVNTPLPELVIDNALEGEGKVTLYWDNEKYKDSYTSYWIEHSKDGKSYQRLNEAPILHVSSKELQSEIISYLDSVPNYQPKSYRIIGVTPFGFLSSPSGSVTGMGRDKTPPSAPTNLKFEEKDATAIISWSAGVENDLTHFNIYRGATYEGHFDKVNAAPIPKADHTYIESSPYLKLSPYYIISAVDSAGNENRSLKLKVFLRDTTPPSPPVGLKGTIDSNGVVSLTWLPNKKDDVAGYMVYFSNQKEYFYTNLTGHQITSSRYNDTITLKTLNEYIYYRVSAVDYYNHISDFSEILELKKPDIIPPQPPHITNLKVVENKVIIVWQNSKSRDVASHYLLKRSFGTQIWDTISRTYTPTYEDGDVNLNVSYEYTCLAKDDDGLVSIKPKPFAILVPKTIKSGILKMNVISYDTLNQLAKIVWESSSEENQNYLLYRSVNQGPFLLLANLAGDKLSYEDKLYERESAIYTYKVRTTLSNGFKTNFSNHEKVEIIHPKNQEK